MRLFKKVLTSFLLLSILAIGVRTILSQDDGFGEDSGSGDVDGMEGMPPSMTGGMGGMDGDYDDPYGGGGGDPYGGGGYGDSHAPATAKELTTLEEIDAFLKEVDDEPSVIGFFDSATNSEDLEHFQEVVKTDGYTHRFAFVTTKEILETKKYDGCAVIVYPASKFINDKLERTKHRFPSKSLAKTNVLSDFIKLKSLPLAGEVTSKSKTIYAELKRPVVTIFSAIDHVRNAKGFAYLANRARKLAKKYDSKIYFNIANTDDFIYDMESEYGFTEPSGKNTVVGLRDGEMFYTMTAKFSFDNLAIFIDEFLSGKLAGTGRERTERTPPPPSDEGEEDDSDSAVIAANQDNLDDIINASDYSMVEFYAPWCGHCKSLKPQYSRVAAHFKEDSSVSIVAFDATASTIPVQYKVEGYPTLYFVSKQNKTPVPYEGAREAKAMIDFIEAQKKNSGSSSEL
jgi:protein disulfide isomerase family A protein 3